MKLGAESRGNMHHFFNDKWNIFDFLMTAALIILTPLNLSEVAVLRVIRCDDRPLYVVFYLAEGVWRRTAARIGVWTRHSRRAAHPFPLSQGGKAGSRGADSGLADDHGAGGEGGSARMQFAENGRARAVCKDTVANQVSWSLV